MNLKSRGRDILRGLTPPLLWSVLRRVAGNYNEHSKLDAYLKSDRRPWRPGYVEYKAKYLAEVLRDEAMLKSFRVSDQLPDGYGFRLDARVVEIPWVLARLARGTGHLLDAGSSLNHEFVVRSPALADKKTTIVTLAPESECHWRLGISYVFGDLRDLGFRDGFFDAVACISTIEHVGMDNTMYLGTKDITQRGDTREFLLAVQEMKRVLKPGGALYVTFPFGKYENHGWFQQFDSQLMDKLIEGFSPSRFNETIFRYDPDGWRLSDRASCADCQFFDVHTSKYFDPSSKIEYPPDYPAGERAVACLELLK
jgi:SAM-dependent methyltransferase